ncbi:poly(A) RNA polymerase, mitochondrial [Calliphora vicina]|uniref:poly(A) RNA polymerase, mitochondrial n=1 Tax=Calliphora vicina TaxID=7373 RepID=UPI00325C1859
MVNDKDTKAINSKCSVCDEKFNNIQECLKHELMKHSIHKKKHPQNRVQKRLNATAKFLNADEKITQRSQLKNELKKCKNGEELQAIFELFCMKTDSLGLIFTRIQTCMERELRPAGIVRIYPFGSIASGLALRDCDIDIYLDASGIHVSPVHKNYKEKKEDANYQQRLAFNRINNLLHRSPHFTDVFGIRGARVPIIKCKHKDTGFSIDINVSCPSSRENTQFIYELVRSDFRIHQLMLFLKLWAKNTQIVGRDNMTSYCLITMVIFYLQQPLFSEKQTKGDSDLRILKSIKELQENCQFHMVQGINYAYNLSHKENKPKISPTVTTWDLIREFFNFYKNFDFENHVISPYYGKSVEKTNLTPAICDEYYKQLRTITQYLEGEQANDLQIDRCMCVQDAFCLNQNTAKNILPHNKQYIMLCLKNAHKICENPKKLKLGELYEQLLFETIKVTDNIKETKEENKTELKTNLKLTLITNPLNTAANNNNNNEGKLIYTLIPSKADIRSLFSHYPDIKGGETILRRWCQQYIEAIETIMTKLYRMDMQKHITAQQKQQKLEQDDKELNQAWLISCSIDLWTNRCFQKNIQTSFMSYQLEQTERLHNLRRQDPKFSVTFNSILKVNTLANYKGIDIQLDVTDGAKISSLNKKSPLRKFFNVFKNTLQSCNFKETLAINTTIAKDVNETIKPSSPEDATSAEEVKAENADNS